MRSLTACVCRHGSQNSASVISIAKTSHQPKRSRDRQVAADKATKTAKRKRTVLGEAFIAAYHTECLAAFDPHSLLADLEEGTQVCSPFLCGKKSRSMSPITGSG